jgi:hypothetical protein
MTSGRLGSLAGHRERVSRKESYAWKKAFLGPFTIFDIRAGRRLGLFAASEMGWPVKCLLGEGGIRRFFVSKGPRSEGNPKNYPCRFLMLQ